MPFFCAPLNIIDGYILFENDPSFQIGVIELINYLVFTIKQYICMIIIIKIRESF